MNHFLKPPGTQISSHMTNLKNQIYKYFENRIYIILIKKKKNLQYLFRLLFSTVSGSRLLQIIDISVGSLVNRKNHNKYKFYDYKIHMKVKVSK